MVGKFFYKDFILNADRDFIWWMDSGVSVQPGHEKQGTGRLKGNEATGVGMKKPLERLSRHDKIWRG